MAAVPDAPIVTTSERRAFKRCPQRWWWEYRDGLRASDQVSVALWFGIGIHEALAHYYGNVGYKRNLDFIDVWRAYCDNDEYLARVRDEDGELLESRALGEAMLTGYHREYGGDPDWDVVYVEKPFEIGIPHPSDPDQDVIAFNSTFDGVYRSKRRKVFRLMEHKTAKTISTEHLPLDDQGGSYYAVASIVLRNEGVLSRGQRIDGIEYNFLRKGEPDARPKDAEGYATNKPQKAHYLKAFQAARGLSDDDMVPWSKMTLTALEREAAAAKLVVLGERSAVQASPLYARAQLERTRAEQRSQIDRLAAEGLAMEQYRSGALPIIKNPTKDCSWDCAFFNMCMLHERGGSDWIDFRDAVFLQRDPYDRYRMLKSA